MHFSGQNVCVVMVKWSRVILQYGQVVSESWTCILRKGWSCYTFFCILSGQGQNVHAVKWSTAGQQPVKRSRVFCDAVKWSSSGKDFLTPVAALTMASMGVSPPCSIR